MRPYFTRACVPHKCRCMRLRSGLTSLEIFSRLAFISLRCWLLRSNGSIHDAGAKFPGRYIVALTGVPANVSRLRVGCSLSRVTFDNSAKSIAGSSGSACARFSVPSKFTLNGCLKDRAIRSVKISIFPPVNSRLASSFFSTFRGEGLVAGTELSFCVFR